MSAAPVVALVTLAHGRHDHLRGMLGAVARGSVVPDVVVVAAMDDADIAPLVASCAPTAARTHVLEVDPGRWGLPLARARNRAAAACRGARVRTCSSSSTSTASPGPSLVERYTAAVSSRGSRSGAVRRGPLPRSSTGRIGLQRSRARGLESAPGTPRGAEPGTERLADDVRLFWSLSFAAAPPARGSDLGGFDETYEGYGGEDTDFAMRLDAAGVRLWWLGGAVAHHQHHPVESPPRGHLADIVRNANLFRQRWGWFPMEGWLSRFAEEGLVSAVGSPPAWHLTTAGHRLVKESVGA